MKTELVQTLTSNFEAHAQQTENGVEYWLARDIQFLLGYSKWDNFLNVVSKAKTACEVSGHPVADHFADVGKTIQMPKTAEKEVPDLMLTRYACYLIAQIRAQLDGLIRLNKTRADFAEKFEELIENYNNGSRNIEQLCDDLLQLSRTLSDEQQRHVRENMTEEELVIFDILTRPAPELSAAERAEVKKIARELLARIKQLLVLNWRQKAASRSQIRLAIEDVLDTGLPRAYDKPTYQQKCSILFEHVYESYPEQNAGVYAVAV